MGDLLPCPFCGGAPSHVSGGFGFSESICCACGCDFDGTPEQWNRRAIPAADARANTSQPVHGINLTADEVKMAAALQDWDAADARAEAWAVFDPNWGEPVPLLTTIRETEADAIGAAITTQERGASIYSGYSTHPVPQILGDWGRMQAHGYSVRRVALITEKQQ